MPFWSAGQSIAPDVPVPRWSITIRSWRRWSFPSMKRYVLAEPIDP